MIRLLVAAGAVALTVTTVWADAVSQTYTRPTVPSSEALSRLNLKVGWRTYLPMDGARDGIASIQTTGSLVLVQMRSGAIVAVDAEDGKTRWTARVGPPYRAAHALGWNYKAVFGFNLTNCFALDRETGELLWQFDLPSTPSAPPVADPERVYVSLSGNRMVAFQLPVKKEEEAKVSQAIVKRDTNTPANSSLPPPPSAGTKNYATAVNTKAMHLNAIGPFTTATKAIEALTATEGLPIDWQFRGDSRLDFAPVFTRRSEKNEGYIVLPDVAGNVAVSTRTPKRILYRTKMDRPLSAPLSVFEFTAYLPTEDNGVSALDIEAGTLAWRYLAGGPIVTAPAVTEDDVYISARRGGVYRLDRITGVLAWRNTDAERFLAANKKWVYAVDATGQLRVIDRARGTTQHTLDVRDFKVPVSNDITDRIFLSANDGLLLCLHDRDIPRPVWNKKVVEERPPDPVKQEAAPAMKKKEGEEKKEEKKDAK